MKKIFIIILFVLLLAPNVYGRETFFKIQSIDTMKFSRDMARAELKAPGYDTEIEVQIKNIAGTGATHVAIGTPYDDEFVPYLKRWVDMAKKYHLHVWFRGNFSGWEKWFDYPEIDRQTHMDKTINFILAHPDLFSDGDIFTACPECENGGPGDPRKTHDVAGFRKFMIDEYNSTKDAFSQIHKNVVSNFDSMNADVARLVMNQETIKAMDNVVTIDHYVKSPDDYLKIRDFFPPGTNLVIGEFGAPIPDLHGNMSEIDQSQWIGATMRNIVQLKDIVAVNYWTNKGSSTAIWHDDNRAQEGAIVLTDYFQPVNISGSVRDSKNHLINDVIVDGKLRSTVTKNGQYTLPIIPDESIYFHKKGYVSVSINVRNINSKDITRDITLDTQQQNKFTDILQQIINSITQFFSN